MPRRQLAQCPPRVLDRDQRAIAECVREPNAAAANDRCSSTFSSRIPQEIVSIELLTLQSKEQVSRLKAPRIGADAPDLRRWRSARKLPRTRIRYKF
jgi:hypothetical protein